MQQGWRHDLAGALAQMKPYMRAPDKQVIDLADGLDVHVLVG